MTAPNEGHSTERSLQTTAWAAMPSAARAGISGWSSSARSGARSYVASATRGMSGLVKDATRSRVKYESSAADEHFLLRCQEGKMQTFDFLRIALSPLLE